MKPVPSPAQPSKPPAGVPFSAGSTPPPRLRFQPAGGAFGQPTTNSTRPPSR